MNALALAILALLTLSPGVYAPQLRHHELGPEARAEQLADQVHEAARLARVDEALLAALLFHESSLDHEAVSSAGARGIGQLMPSSRWGRAADRECEEARKQCSPDACELIAVRWAAWALRDSIQACGSHLRALGMYRTGRCVAGPRGRATVQLAQNIRWRLHHRSTRPLRVPMPRGAR